MNKTRIGVLRGGPSAEYEVSLKTGQSVITALPDSRYEIKDILVDKLGNWHYRGFPSEPLRITDQVDVVFNALHGAYGEDGGVQKFFETHGVKYTGSNALSSAISMNKDLTKNTLEDGPFRRASHRIIDRSEYNENTAHEIFRSFMQPSVIKPVSGGSSVATYIVQTYDELKDAIEESFMESDRTLIERYVNGREATVAVANDFRGEELYAFPPIEIVYNNGTFFDYNEKYSDSGAREICPAPFERDISERLLESAKFVHKKLGLRDYSRSDFIITGRGDIYFLEVNTLPGLTPASLLPKAVIAVGSTLPHFLEHIVGLALQRK